MSKDEYDEKGYTIYRKHISDDVADIVCQSVIRDACNIVFKDEPYPPDPNDPDTLSLFTDFNFRKKRLNNPKCVWRDGNTRKPIISKSTGMINICFNHDVQEHVTFNPLTIQRISNLYGTSELVYKQGFDRVCIKAKGSTDMQRHLDYHLNNPSLQFDSNRVQAFVCGKCPTDIPVHQSGTIEMIPYFHLYWKSAQKFFTSPFGKIKIHQLVPQQLGKDFDQKLSMFNEFNRRLHTIRDNQLPITPDWEPYKDIIETLPDKFHELQWTPIDLRTGDMICWDQKLPHRSLRNKSSTPRIVFYIRLYKTDDNWADSNLRRQLASDVSSGIVRGNQDNTLERMSRPPQYQWLLNPTDTNRKLAGLDSY